MAIENLITDHLDLWTAAVRPKSSAGRGSNSKLELTGIKKLRELILELAVRGKLVPQDPNDEPASVLLERIAAEKTRLVKEGKIKKPKALPEISEEEKRFELPKGWAELRLGTAINVLNGRAYKKHEMLESGTPLLRVGNLFTSDKWYYSDLELEPEKYIDNGDLIYSWSASFGPFIWNGGRVIYHYHIWKMDIFDPDSLDKHFMCLYLDAISASIKASGNGIAMVHMTKEKMEQLVIPIPPISEQHRIVAKVDELMALCDQLEQHSESQLAAHQTLVETLLATLTDFCDADELAQNWARLSTHFDTLFTTEASIDALKQSILQLAVTGTLVSWGNNVREEKLKHCVSFGPRNGFSPKETTEDTGFYVLKLGATSYGKLNLTEIKNIDVAIEKESHLFIRKNDILIQRGNSAHYVGSNCLVECDVDGIIYPDLMMKITVNHKVSAKYMSLWLSSPRARRFMWDRMTGTSGTMPKISKKVVEEIPVMVPLMAYQNDIVAKVDELMIFCDQLKSRLQTSVEVQSKLAGAVVENSIR